MIPLSAPPAARPLLPAPAGPPTFKSAGGFDYVWLSPIFDSISKSGYESAFRDKDELRRLVAGCPAPVYALGGEQRGAKGGRGVWCMRGQCWLWWFWPEHVCERMYVAVLGRWAMAGGQAGSEGQGRTFSGGAQSRQESSMARKHGALAWSECMECTSGGGFAGLSARRIALRSPQASPWTRCRRCTAWGSRAQ